MKAAAESAKLKKGVRRNRFVPTDDTTQAARELFVETILIDWENVVDYRVEGGKTMMPFNRENALWLLSDLPDLFEYLTQEAQNPDNFVLDEDEELDAKN